MVGTGRHKKAWCGSKTGACMSWMHKNSGHIGGIHLGPPTNNEEARSGSFFRRNTARTRVWLHAFHCAALHGRPWAERPRAPWAPRAPAATRAPAGRCRPRCRRRARAGCPRWRPAARAAGQTAQSVRGTAAGHRQRHGMCGCCGRPGGFSMALCPGSRQITRTNHPGFQAAAASAAASCAPANLSSLSKHEFQMASSRQKRTLRKFGL